MLARDGGLLTMDHQGNERSYEVGYCKPPKEALFKKGQSGNPSGRPKGSKSLRAVIQEVLDTKVLVTIGGKRRKVTKKHLIVETAVNEALVSKNFKLLESLGVFKEAQLIEAPEIELEFTLKLEEDSPPPNDALDDDYDYSQPQLKGPGSKDPG